MTTNFITVPHYYIIRTYARVCVPCMLTHIPQFDAGLVDRAKAMLSATSAVQHAQVCCDIFMCMCMRVFLCARVCCFHLCCAVPMHGVCVPAHICPSVHVISCKKRGGVELRTAPPPPFLSRCRYSTHCYLRAMKASYDPTSTPLTSLTGPWSAHEIGNEQPRST